MDFSFQFMLKSYATTKMLLIGLQINDYTFMKGGKAP